jgi:hypothetical protein
MTSLNLSSNHMGKLVAQTATHQVLLKQLRSQGMALKDAMAQVAQLKDSPLGIFALADAIKGNGAMTSLNLASNYLDADGAKIIAEAIKVIKCAIAVVLAPFSYSSDQWLNCCCLLLSAEYGGPIAAVVEGQQACHPRRWKGIGPSFGEQLHPQGVGCIQQYLEGWKRPLAG